MITIGRLHRLTITGTPILATLAVLNGSVLLAAVGSVLVLALLWGAASLEHIERSRLRLALVHGATVLALIAVLSSFRDLGIDGVLIVAMLGIFNRFLLRGGHRDDFLVVGASSVLLAAATTITPGVTFLFVLLLFVPTLLWALWASMMLGTGEDQATELAHKRAAIRGIALRPAPAQARFIALSGLGLMGFGYAAVSVLPRYTFAGFLSAGAFMPLPGASNAMELRTTGAETLGDATVVLRVEPGPNTPASELQGLYARVYVLDELDGRTFRTSADAALFPLGLPVDKLPEGPTDSELTAADPAGTVRVTLNRLQRDSTTHPLVTIGRLGPTEVLRRHARRTVSGGWVAPGFRGSALTYKARLDRRFEAERLPTHLLERQATRLLGVPDSVDPRVVQLGRDLAAGKKTTEERVRAVLAHFQRGFTYSLEPMEGTSPDPLARFLFEAKRGHCELYAGAVAVLLRVAGVKARVATGYYSGKWNDLGGYVAFTQQDAHAWVEAYFEGEGWRWVDATPEDLRAARPTSILAFLRDWYDAAEASWFDNVVDFDEAKRRQLVERLSQRFSGLGELAEGLLGEGGEGEASGPRRAGPLTALLALAVVGLGAGLFFRGAQRRRLPESIGRRLRRALGAKDHENTTLGGLLGRVPEGARADAAACVAAYEALRFGPARDAPAPEVVLDGIRALDRRLRRERRRGVG